MSLPAARVVSVSRSRSDISVRLGMTPDAVSCGVWIAEPIAGAILSRSDNKFLNPVACASALMLSGFIL
jgi:hypothetical protein